MTANVLKGRADKQAFSSLLDDVAPDVLVIQELGHNLVSVVADRYANHSLHPSDDFIGRGIATNFEAEFGTIDMPVRVGTSAEIAVGELVWHVAGAHLANAVEWPYWRSVRARSAQLEAFEAWLDDRQEAPIVLAGDINASPAWPAYKRLARRLDDVVAGPNARNTWGWRPGWPAMLRIDHVFASGLAVDAVFVVPIAGSDHRAVAVDLRLA